MPDYKINIWHKGRYESFCGHQSKPHTIAGLERHHELLLSKIWPKDKFAIFVREGKGKFELLKELK